MAWSDVTQHIGTGNGDRVYCGGRVPITNRSVHGNGRTVQCSDCLHGQRVANNKAHH